MTRTTVRRFAAFAAVGVAAVAIAVQPGVASADDDSGSSDLLRSGLVGSTPVPDGGPLLFGVSPGGAPWVIDRGELRVDSDGEFDVRVRGLVIPPPIGNGTNPVTTLSASLVCNGAIAATTAAVPFDSKGNARIDTKVSVPSPCLAPAVLIHPRTNIAAYIAANG